MQVTSIHPSTPTDFPNLSGSSIELDLAFRCTGKAPYLDDSTTIKHEILIISVSASR